MAANQYINGKCVEGNGQPFEVVNPATDEVIATVPAADESQTNNALGAAHRAFETWSRTSIAERLGWIARLRDACRAEQDVLVDLLAREVGKSYPEAEAECRGLAIILDFFAEEVKRVYGTTISDYTSRRGEALHVIRKYPVGVAVGLLAWNFPIQGAALKLGPALATGCTCILKPSRSTPLATFYLGVIGEKIGFPEGVFNILAGPAGTVGKTLNQSRIPRLITLIGSSESGRQVMAEAATSIKRFSLELGGNAPAVVMPDADLDAAARFMVARKVRCCGQDCANINRVYVHAGIHDEFVGLLRKHLEAVRVGWGKELGNAMGPLINRAARARVLGLITDAIDKGGQLVYGGRPPATPSVGSFLLPTLLDQAQDTMRLRHEEIFGPVLPVYTFNDLDAAIAAANDTDYGLCSYLFTHDSRVIARASENLEFGEVLVNNPPGGNFIPLPHIGIKESGVGCDGSLWALEPYLWMRRVSIRP